MRGPKIFAMGGVFLAALLGAMVVIAPIPGAAKAQQSPTIPGPKVPGLPPIDGDRAEDAHDPMLAQQRAGRARAMQEDRQKHIVDESARLLQLATELKVSVDKSTKSEMPPDVIRKTDDIEKLAHDVKTRMRS